MYNINIEKSLDLSVLSGFLREIEDYFPGTGPLSLACKQPNIETWAKKLNSTAFFVTTRNVDNKIVGCIIVYLNNINDYAYITLLAVLRKYQGNSLASEMFSFLFDFLQKNNRLGVKLECYYENAAMRFYSKLGFTYDKTLPEIKNGFIPLVFNFHNTESPKVSILTTVYNHESYLRQCLDGFVMQKTNFAFEAIVHDDASTDSSAAIIREYAEKYPNIIKPIYETENQYSKNDGSLTRIMNAAVHPNAKYIAICEGDDYWTDPYKLQKQFDFLESHSEYSLCCHETNQFRQKTGEMFYVPIKGLKQGFSFDLEYYVTGVWIIQTLTLFYRRSAYNFDHYKLYKSPMDATLFYHLLSNGKGYLMPEVMSVYRIHSGGAYSGKKYAVFFKWYMKTIEGIHNVENSNYSKMYLYNILRNHSYKVLLSADLKTFMQAIKMSVKYLGSVKSLYVVLNNLYLLFLFMASIIKSKIKKYF